MSKSGIAEAVNTRAPSPPDSADASPRWARALEQWRVTPIDDPVWDEVESFIDALRTVTVEKVTERNRGREILRKDVEELCRDCASEIEYFEAQTSTWQADAIPWDKAELVAARIA